MITIRILLSAVFVFCITISFGQLNSSVASTLSGKWFLANAISSANGDLIYKRFVHPHNWGDRIEFNDSLNFVDAYSAKCGNDDNIHNTKGSWTLSDKIIQTTIPIYTDKATKHEIVYLSADSLVLRKIE
jgi:hypothetical protein